MINSKVKAQSAFKKLGAVTLIIVALIACKHESVNNSTPMFTVAFSIVDGKGGTLTAKAEGEAAETGKSPITVEQGKLITFTAKASDGYEIDKWSISNGAFEAGTGAAGSEIAKAKITSSVSITVAFKLKKYKVTFSVDSTTPNGTLTAKADGIDETSTSPINVEHGKELTFTAKADTGYRVKGWTLDGNPIAEAGTKAEYSHTVTTAATVQVSFEVLSTVEGGALLILNPDNHDIGVTAKTADGSAIVVEGCTETTLESEKDTELHAKGTGVILKGKITEFNCQSVQLTGLKVQGLTSLEKLECNQNQLTSLDVSGLASLKELICPANQLESLNMQGCTSLLKLDCSSNQFKSLEVQDLASLEVLDCGGNQLTTLSVQGLAKLRVLYCGINQLESLNVKDCAKLQDIKCYVNKLTAEAFTKLFGDLPTHQESVGAKAILYTEIAAFEDGNCKDFSQGELKTAFENAKDVKKWNLQKQNASGSNVEI